jgi:hypothetical protein
MLTKKTLKTKRGEKRREGKVEKRRRGRRKN